MSLLKYHKLNHMHHWPLFKGTLTACPTRRSPWRGLPSPPGRGKILPFLLHLLNHSLLVHSEWLLCHFVLVFSLFASNSLPLSVSWIHFNLRRYLLIRVAFHWSGGTIGRCHRHLEGTRWRFCVPTVPTCGKCSLTDYLSAHSVYNSASPFSSFFLSRVFLHLCSLSLPVALSSQPSSSTSDVKPIVGLGSVAAPQASHNEVATSKQPRKGRKAIAEKTVGPAKTTKKAPKAAAARFDP